MYNIILRNFIFYLVWVVVAETSPVASPPHIVLILADDLGWNDISWNNPRVISPNLAALNSGGVQLNMSYVLNICTPTRSALLTARYPYTMGRQKNVIYPTCPTGLTLNATLLPEELKALGYDTHAVGKWHLGFCKWEYVPTSRGFDSFFGFYIGGQHYYTHRRTAQCIAKRQDNNLKSSNRTCEGYDFRNNRTVDYGPKGEYSAFAFADHVENLLKSRDTSVPMFLYLPLQSVHGPLEVPSKYTDMYPDELDTSRRIKLGMVTAMDDAVGQVVAALKDTGHYDNSVIVFTTDNGGPIRHAGNNWPLRGQKGSLWEGGTRGPAFVHSPLLATAGTVSNRMIHVTDWYPTLLHLAGGETPSGVDGVNQWEALSDAAAPDARKQFVYDIDDTDGIIAAIRWGRYKLFVGEMRHSEWYPEPLLNGESRQQNYMKYEFEELSQHDVTEDLVELETMTLYLQDLLGETTDGNGILNNVDKQQQEMNTLFKNVVKSAKFSSAVNFDYAINYVTQTINSWFSLSPDNESSSVGSTHVSEKFKKEKRKHKHQHRNTKNRKIVKVSDVTKLEDLFQLETQLYNVEADPSERVNLAASHPQTVKLILSLLLHKMVNYVTKDEPPIVAEANPENYNDTWSPGWC